MDNFLQSNPISLISEVTKLHIEPQNMLFCPSRKNHGLVFFIDGTSEYVFNDKTVKVGANSLLFLPKRQAYSIKRDEYAECIYVDFDTSDNIGYTPFAKSYSNSSQFKELFLYMLNISNTKAVGYEAMLMSTLYKVIALIQTNNNAAYLPNSHYQRISESVEYLKANFFDENITTPQLAEMCGVSPRYYTKLFNAFFMCSPKKYIIDLKIGMAKKLLISTKYQIHEVSETCGFSDVYYFCKVFKKATDMSPTEYRKKIDSI